MGLIQRHRIDRILDNFFISRISLRFLVDTYISSKRNKPGFSGVIESECSPVLVREGGGGRGGGLGMFYVGFSTSMLLALFEAPHDADHARLRERTCMHCDCTQKSSDSPPTRHTRFILDECRAKSTAGRLLSMPCMMLLLACAPLTAVVVARWLVPAFENASTA